VIRSFGSLLLLRRRNRVRLLDRKELWDLRDDDDVNKDEDYDVCEMVWSALRERIVRQVCMCRQGRRMLGKGVMKVTPRSAVDLWNGIGVQIEGRTQERCPGSEESTV
jgi:hypothetical protein